MKAYLDPEEVQLLEEVAAYARDRLLVRVLFHLGCRISEALAIEVKDVDFHQGTVTIVHLKAQKRLACPGCGTRLGSTHVFCPGCGQKVERALADEREHRKVRTLPVDHATLEMMRDYIDRGGPVSVGGKQLLFGITRGHAWKIVKDCAQAAGLEKLVNPETGRAHNVS
ncbi:MAG: tyrosine-type recombinase/integrase, partial [Chloroflexota bacterium]|nr:tyrosine-type recombinase/integrase [Chloroflexota bacterium]